MNEHIIRGREALDLDDLQTATYEFKLAKKDPSLLTRRIAESQLKEIKDRKILENKTVNKSELDSSKYGYLSDLGYHVGSEGIPKSERRKILREAFFDVKILKEERWEPAGTAARHGKLCSWFNFRISSNQGRLDMIEAVDDWKEDLRWLEFEFKKEVFSN